MANEVWIGFVEVRQLPGEDHEITLSGNETSYRARVEEVEARYGLFVVDIEDAMRYSKAEELGVLNEELAEICERTCENESYCIFGTFHNYPNDN
jgi:hypothetical protein